MLTDKMHWLAKIVTSTAKMDKISKSSRITLGQKAKNKSKSYSFQGNKRENEKYLHKAYQNTYLHNNSLVVLNKVQ